MRSRRSTAACVEDLKVKNMTASVKGAVENPGKNVKQKTAPDLRTGFYSLRQAIEWQLLKVGGVVIPVDPRGTSITCTVDQEPAESGDFQVHQRKLRFKANAERGGRPERVEGPSAHNKKHIAHVVSIGERGFSRRTRCHEMGSALNHKRPRG